MENDNKKRELGKIVVTAELDTKEFEKSLQGLKSKINDFEKEVSSKTIKVDMFASISEQSSKTIDKVTKDTTVMVDTISKSFNDVSKNTKQILNNIEMPEFKFKTSDLREPETRFKNMAQQIQNVTKGLAKTKALVSEERKLFKDIGNQNRVTQKQGVKLSKDELENIKERSKWLQIGLKDQRVQSKEQLFSLIHLKEQLETTKAFEKYQSKMTNVNKDLDYQKSIKTNISTLGQLQAQLSKVESKGLDTYSETLRKLSSEIKDFEIIPSKENIAEFTKQFETGLKEVSKELKNIEQQNKQAFANTQVGQAYKGLNNAISKASKNIKSTSIVLERVGNNVTGINTMIGNINKQQSAYNQQLRETNRLNSSKKPTIDSKVIDDAIKVSEKMKQTMVNFNDSFTKLDNKQINSNMSILKELISEVERKIKLTTLGVQAYKTALNGVTTDESKKHFMTLNSELDKQKLILSTLNMKLEQYESIVTKSAVKTGNLATGVKYLSDKVGKMSSKFKRAMWSTLRWSLALSGMSGVFWALRTSASDIIQANDKMQASIKGLTQAFGQALKPVIDSLVPVFQKMVVWTTFLINSVIVLTNTLFNLSNSIITSFSPLPGKLDKTAKAMARLKKQAEKTIAPFDQLNIISNLKLPDQTINKDIAPDFADMNTQLENANKNLEKWGKSIEFLRGQGDKLLDWAKKLGLVFLSLWGVKKIADFINMVKDVGNAFGFGKKSAEGLSKTLGGMTTQKFAGAVTLLTSLIAWGHGIYKQFFKADASLGTFFQTLGASAGVGIGLGVLTGNPWIGLAGGIATATASLLGFNDAYNKTMKKAVDQKVFEGETLEQILFYEQKLKNITQLSRTAFKVENPDALKNTISTLTTDLDGYKKELEKIDTDSIVAIDENKYNELQRKIKLTELKIKYYNNILEGVDVNNIVTFKKDALMEYDDTMKRLIDQVNIFEKIFSEEELKGNLTYLKLKKQLESYGYTHQSVYKDVRTDISKTEKREEEFRKNSEEGWDGLIKKVKEFGKATLEATKKIGNWIIESEKNQSESWGDARYQLPSQSKIKPSLNPLDWFKFPKFANGGVVKSPTLGLIGEYSGASSNPEIISPQSTMESVFENTLSKYMSNNNQPIQVDMTVNLGGTQVGHSIIKLINSTQRVYGKTMIEV